MRSSILFYLLAVISIQTYSCNNNSCPNEVVIDHVRTPLHVDESIDEYINLDSILFVDVNGNEVKYFIQDRIYKEIFRKDEQEVSCLDDEDRVVDIDLDSEETTLLFKSRDDLELKISYRPDNSRILDPYDQDVINTLNPVYRFYLDIELPGFLTLASVGGVAMWDNQESVDFFAERHLGPFTLGGIAYENVFFWRYGQSNRSKIYYLENNVVVGVSNEVGRLWIRKIEF